LFQDPDDQLFCNTLDEDVAFGPLNQGLSEAEVERRVAAALQRVDLAHLRYKPPHHLSYGQKKRAALATLLAMEPDVLILDEPTANLDPKQEKLISELLQGFRGTLVCISHDLPFLYGLCSRAVVLDGGTIHHDFSMQELVSFREFLREHGLDSTFRFNCCRGDDHSHDEPHHHVLPYNRPENALIQLAGYSYRYPDGTWGVRDVDLSIGERESVAIVGENGAGKSTLVSCIAGVLKGRGEYLLDGKAVSADDGLWRQIGLVFQDPRDQLFCVSVREEVAFGPRQLRLSSAEIAERIEESLALVNLTGYEDRVPHHLSAGERKRVALASVLAMRPRVIILDEPTANLDPRSEQLLCDILRRLDVTKILISHDIDLISHLCGRTVVMDSGRPVRDYATSDFVRDSHLISMNGLDYTFKNHCFEEIRKLQTNGAGR
ncbi:MAG: ABC transporter ATP-binding protein, partial [Acidobacteriota bacterium]